MKIKFLFSFILISSLLGSVCLASDLFDYYNINDITSIGFSGNNWEAQTFTAVSTYTPTSVKIKVSRYPVGSSPGTLTASLQGTVSGHPDSSDLCTGNTNANAFTEYPTFTWYEIDLASCPEIDETVVYAVVVRVETTSVEWRENPNNGFVIGNREFSANGGINWSTSANVDYMFEVWGNVGTPPPPPGQATSTPEMILENTFFAYFFCVGDWLPVLFAFAGIVVIVLSFLNLILDIDRE